MKKLLLIVILLVAITTNAQYSKTINSGRPGQSVSAFAVGKNIFQVQAGMDYTKQNAFSPNSFFRFGVSKNIEINHGVQFDNGRVSSFSLGSRLHFFTGDSMLPSTGMQVSVSTDEDFQDYSASAIFIFENTIGKFNWNFNIGIAADFFDLPNPGQKQYHGIYVFNVSYPLNDQFTVFIEPYGTIKNINSDYKIDGGIAYLFNEDLQFDFLTGYDFVNEDYLFGLGVSWRVLTK